MWVCAVRARILPDYLRKMYQRISDLIPVLHATNAHNYPANGGTGAGGGGGGGGANGGGYGRSRIGRGGGASARTPRKHGGGIGRSGLTGGAASSAMARARLAADLSSANGAQWDWS